MSLGQMYYSLSPFPNGILKNYSCFVLIPPLCIEYIDDGDSFT